MNSKSILLATVVFSAILSASAWGDNYYFRSKGSPVSSVPGDADNGGEETPPENSVTASIGFVADKYRAGTTISGTLDTSLTTPSWSFSQTPPTPAISFVNVDGGFTATAPAVEDATTFQVTATASEGDRSGSANPAPVTVYSVLSISGGPVGEINGITDQPVETQPAYILKGLAGTATYTLMQSSAPMATLETQCPGLSFSPTDGQISGTPTAVCSIENLTVKVKDSFDEAEATSGVFSISTLPGPSNVMSWGSNHQGQLGDGTTTNKSVPTHVLSGKAYIKVVAGTAHACGLTGDGKVECWGSNSQGQIGDGVTATTSRPFPAAVLGLTGAVSTITAGSDHTCAIVSGGAMECWGGNSYGQLGDNSTTSKRTAVRVYGLSSGVTSISAGSGYTCAVVSGAAKCWGAKTAGQLGDGTNNSSSIPVQVSGLNSGVSVIAAGRSANANNHTCAILSSGGIKCWGYNYGALGNGDTPNQPTPVDVLGISNASAIVAGTMHTCAITSEGVKCWGYNGQGQLGTGNTTSTLVPVNVPGLIGATSITTGYDHTCVTISGGVKCWGANSTGQLGEGTTTERHVPTLVLGLPSSMSAVSAATNSTYSW